MQGVQGVGGDAHLHGHTVPGGCSWPFPGTWRAAGCVLGQLLGSPADPSSALPCPPKTHPSPNGGQQQRAPLNTTSL